MKKAIDYHLKAILQARLQAKSIDVDENSINFFYEQVKNNNFLFWKFHVNFQIQVLYPSNNGRGIVKYVESDLLPRIVDILPGDILFEENSVELIRFEAKGLHNSPLISHKLKDSGWRSQKLEL
jgi:hypothetical protein